MSIPVSQSRQFDFDFEQEPYSYAAEKALSEKERSVEELEAAVKETPPRSSMQLNGSPSGRTSSSEPRAIGDVMDESEKMLPLGSPGLRHKKGRLEHNLSNKSTPQSESFADVVKHELESPPATPSKPAYSHNKENIPPPEHESYASIVKHETNKTNDEALDMDNTNKGDSKAVAVAEEEERLSSVIKGDIPAADNRRQERLVDVVSAIDNNKQEQNTNKQEQNTNKQEQNTNGVRVVENGIKRKPVQSKAQVTNGNTESYAEVVRHEPTSPSSQPDNEHDGQDSLTKVKSEEDFADTATVVSDGDVSHNRNESISQKTEANQPEESEQPVEPVDVQNTQQAKPGALVYENYHSRSGTNLASIQLEPEYDMALEQAEKEKKPAAEKSAVQEQSTRVRLVSGRRAGAGWSRSPLVRWAPLNMPLQRRLQSLAVLAHSLSIAGLLAFFFVLCAIPIFWPILLPYLIYVLLSRAPTDGKLTHRSEWIRRSKFWSLFASYFPARLHRTVELEATRKYIFGYHPHGIISHGAFAAFTTEALGFGHLFPGITNTLLTLDSNFRVPLYRDWALRLGMASVSRESCENLLSKGGPNGEGMGRAITIVIGGARESLDAKPGTLNLVLKRRKGFVKLAVRTGADLVPVLAFGENDMYEQIDSEAHPWIHKGQMLVKKFMGFTVPLFHARGLFNYDIGIFPYRRPINIVVGRPIRTVQSRKPDPDYVDKLHKQYTDELLHIWDEWKDVFAPDRKCELQIIE